MCFCGKKCHTNAYLALIFGVNFCKFLELKYPIIYIYLHLLLIVARNFYLFISISNNFYLLLEISNNCYLLLFVCV